MVWGMSLPSTFGEFWPDGECEGEGVVPGASGWRERLQAYYLKQTPEIRKALFNYVNDGLGNDAHFYPGYVARKFTDEIGTCEPGFPPLIPIKPHEPPRSYEIIRGTKSIGSFVTLSGGPFVVNSALMAIIEQIEPNVHQFFPIEMSYRDKIYSDKHYSFVIGQYIDSFSPMKSDKKSWRPNGANDYFHEDNKKGISNLALFKSMFGKAHLWLERRMSFTLVCLSDNLQAEIAEAGLRIPKHYRMKEV